MNLPNTLTIFRILLTFLFLFLLSQRGLGAKVCATLTFAVASLTDYLDGYLAKKRNLITDFGKLMDPIADKFLILTAFYCFTRMNIVALWMFIIIAIREILITALRLMATTKGRVIAAEKAGKYKTALQIMVIGLILTFITLQETRWAMNWSEDVFRGWNIIINVFMVAVVFLTIYSGIAYSKQP